MLDFYAWDTPNGRKVAIMFAETGLEHRLLPIDITAGAQHDPEFLAVSPNNKIPAIVEILPDGSRVGIFESGAILTYIAERTNTLLPEGDARWPVLQWLHWSIGGLGPMLGQLNYFANKADAPDPPAIERFAAEGARLLSVLERQVARTGWVGGDAYTIADIVSFPWVALARAELHASLGETFAASPAIRDWLERVGSRPAVKAGLAELARLSPARPAA